ncbi:hypothetical protein ABIC56_002795 [Acinetobacter bereziniae]|uniref:hypothetical protein n=1 Tax=Acinetobacter bereziniae TaxID=106648 RepID=UPI0022EA89A7|nr:hypothetical protein [Acinetobacter bereziniae]MDA3442643.1 hypothetical protein [Acinetobacter bereziniae]MDR6541617.1 hypothetical protein [Acinetobacter bereziniae]
MSKKTLKEKIKLVWVWALILSVVYFTIGVYLKSDGYKFDPFKAYELLKDTLTLTATFLAPVAAFVLFSDWRVQHRNLSNEKIALSLYRSIESLNSKFLLVAINLQTKHPRTKAVFDEIDSEIKAIDIEIQKIILENNSIHANDEDMEKFLQYYYDLIQNDFVSIYGTFGMVLNHFKILAFPDNHKNLFLKGETDHQFIERRKRQFLGVDELTLFKELKEFRCKLDTLYELLNNVKV